MTAPHTTEPNWFVLLESAIKRIARVHPGTSTFVDSAQVDSGQKVQFINGGARANARRNGKPA
jgi:hypothetical protein